MATPRNKYLAKRRQIMKTNPGDWKECLVWMYETKPQCRICLRNFSRSKKFRFAGDHVLPLAAGGGNECGNFQPLCKPCHKAKTKIDMGLIAFYKACVRISQKKLVV